MAMFNILSGLQEGSRSVTIVSRQANTGQGPFLKGNVVVTSGGKVSAASDTSIPFHEFIFEDLTGNSSGQYTCAYGTMEAEVDQIDDSTNGAIVADCFLTAVAGVIAKASAADITGGLYFGKCISTSTVVNMVAGTSAKVVRFRTK